MSSQENYDNYIFQILEVNKELIENNSEEKGINIVVGTLNNIRQYYQQEEYNILDVNGQCVEDEDKDKFFNDYLPSPGVKVKTSFLGEDQNTDLKYAEFSTVRFLLQSRKLSQIMTKTWLDDSDYFSSCINVDKEDPKKIMEEKRIKYINKIFQLFNYKPQELSLLVEGNKGIEKETLTRDRVLIKLLSPDTAVLESNRDNNNLNFSYDLQKDYTKALILELFLSGQAYIVDDTNLTLQRLNEPIFSTYELIWEYELDLSWDTYYAKREDIARPGYRQIKPQALSRVILGLPAKPNDQSLKCEEIIKWVYAKEEHEEKNAFSVPGAPKGGETEFPFYPEEGSEEWKNKQVKNVFPPYPYIILSCT